MDEHDFLAARFEEHRHHLRAVAYQLLAVPADTCRVSALHGLGHWAAADPAQVEAIITPWVRAQSGLRPERHRYADAARHGCVRCGRHRWWHPTSSGDEAICGRLISDMRAVLLGP